MRDWLKEKHRCFKTEITKGLKQSIIDVVGVTDVGGELSGEVETMAVEVKWGTGPFAKAAGQTLAYKVYANRIYLADLKDFNHDEISIASHLGIGLIQIQNKECQEVLSSPYYVPIEKLNLQLLEGLALGRCQLCGYFVAIGDEHNRFSKISNKKALQKEVNAENGLIFWNESVDERKRKAGIQTKKEGYIHERRFICSDCISTLFPQLKVKDEK